jgi:hypothetical protein
MDELAAAAARPLNSASLISATNKGGPRYRLRAVLEAAAERFNWKERQRNRPNRSWSFVR